MARIQPIKYEDAPSESKPEWNRQVETYGRMTNMKKTLARSPVALNSYMKWYDLEKEVEQFLGRRLTFLFAHAISAQTDCLICSTYFCRHLIDSGENPENLILNEREQLFVNFGRQIAKDAHSIKDELYDEVAEILLPEQMVALVAFAGLMVATNLINNVLLVDLDEYLEKYKKRT